MDLFILRDNLWIVSSGRIDEENVDVEGEHSCNGGRDLLLFLLFRKFGVYEVVRVCGFLIYKIFGNFSYDEYLNFPRL